MTLTFDLNRIVTFSVPSLSSVRWCSAVHLMINRRWHSSKEHFKGPYHRVLVHRSDDKNSTRSWSGLKRFPTEVSFGESLFSFLYTFPSSNRSNRIKRTTPAAEFNYFGAFGDKSRYHATIELCREIRLLRSNNLWSNVMLCRGKFITLSEVINQCNSLTRRCAIHSTPPPPASLPR